MSQIALVGTFFKNRKSAILHIKRKGKVYRSRFGFFKAKNGWIVSSLRPFKGLWYS